MAENEQVSSRSRVLSPIGGSFLVIDDDLEVVLCLSVQDLLLVLFCVFAEMVAP